MRALPLDSKPWAGPLAALLIALPGVLLGQAGTVGGTIVAQGSQRPVAGVEVGVAGAAGREVLTDGSGRFKLTDLSGGTVVLNVRFLGYRPVVDTVPVGKMDGRIELVERALELNSVVVTGTAGGAQTRELGTSVAVVNVAEVQAQAAIPSFQGLINGRAPGVDVIQTTGQVGAGSQIRIRGVGSGPTDAASITALIASERQRVLFLEGFRGFDIERLGLPLVPAPGSPYLQGGVYGATVCLPVPDIERDNNPNIVASQIISGVRGEFTVP